MTRIEEREVRTGEESVRSDKGTGIEVENMIGIEREIAVTSMTETENMGVNENVIGTATGIAVEDASI